jgi:hypothetical protein
MREQFHRLRSIHDFFQLPFLQLAL